MSHRLIQGATLLKREIYADSRGVFSELWNADSLEANSLSFRPTQTNYSVSSKGVFRGFHLQLPPYGQAKLISVIQGRILDVFLSLRPADEIDQSFGWAELGAESGSLLLDKSVAHGFLALEEQTTVCYHVDSPRVESSEISINAVGTGSDIPSLFAEYGFPFPHLSDRDKAAVDYDAFLRSHGHLFR